MTKRRKYSQELKAEAIKMVIEQGLTVQATGLSHGIKLGIRRDTLEEEKVSLTRPLGLGADETGR
jgi:transposase-like protein